MRAIRWAAVPALALLIGGPVSVVAAAETAPSGVVLRQSVKTELSPSGEPGTSRVFTQLTSAGAGVVELPRQSTSGLRNLDGFGRPSAADGVVRHEFSGAGETRTVADHTADLPVTIAAVYTLDGEHVSPEDLVGRSGTVTATFTITNVSGVEQELSFQDAVGNAQSETLEVPVPLVGSLGTTLDGRFVDVEAPGGVVAGDGRGSTVVNFSVLLFPPLGSDTATVSYTARVHDAVVPPVSVQVIPVTSDSFGSLASAAETYQGAASDLYTLHQGSLTIDRNLLRLATGLTQLLDGVVKLSEGADALRDGLGDAADGSGRLSEGLGKARDGGGKLADGLGDLEDGAGRLSNGLTAANAGGAKLVDGLWQISDGNAKLLSGLETLKAGINDPATGLPFAQSGAAQLHAASQKVLAGLGTLATSGTLVYGTDAIYDGLLEVAAGVSGLSAGVAGKIKPGVGLIETGATKMIASVDNVSGCSVLTLLDADATNDTPCGAKDLLQFIAANGDPLSQGLAAALVQRLGTVADGASDDPQTLLGGLAKVRGGAQRIGAGLGTVPANCQAAAAAAAAETTAMGAPSVLTALELIECGLGAVGTENTLIDGANRVRLGLYNPGAAPGQPGANPTCTDPSKQPCGVQQAMALIEGGLGKLAGGLGLAIEKLNAGLGSADVAGETLIYGAKRLADGSGEAAAGGDQLSAGLQQLDDGGKKLADGAGRAASGAGELADGLVKLDDGGAKLADGLDRASDGSGKLADGLALARIGAGQAESGARRLQSQGTTALAEGVADSATDTNRTLATLKAVDERGRADGAPYGAPEGAVVTAAYQFDLAGVGQPDGGPGTGAKTAGAAALFGSTGALAFARRRFGLG